MNTKYKTVYKWNERAFHNEHCGCWGILAVDNKFLINLPISMEEVASIAWVHLVHHIWLNVLLHVTGGNQDFEAHIATCVCGGNHYLT